MSAGGKKVSEMHGGSIMSAERIKVIKKDAWNLGVAMHHLRIMHPDTLTGVMALIHKDLMREAERLLIQFEEFEQDYQFEESDAEAKVSAVKAVIDGMSFNAGIEKGSEVDKALCAIFDLVDDG